ncbi:MAG TPA: zinc ribbon domain-containing protein [Candidatus Dormibacteraeota bacterium]|nr:zinc ribbon domain-containing protein [Candidatus Dormibacteraeota bacterium]
MSRPVGPAARRGRRGERGIIIFGGRRTVKPLGILQARCPRCGQVAAQRLVRSTRWFTLFFIPVIPLGSRHIATCTYCGSAVEVPRDAVDGLLGGQAGPGQVAGPQAIPPPAPPATPPPQWYQQMGATGGPPPPGQPPPWPQGPEPPTGAPPPGSPV